MEKINISLDKNNFSKNKNQIINGILGIIGVLDVEFNIENSNLLIIHNGKIDRKKIIKKLNIFEINEIS